MAGQGEESVVGSQEEQEQGPGEQTKGEQAMEEEQGILGAEEQEDEQKEQGEKGVAKKAKEEPIGSYEVLVSALREEFGRGKYQ